jgi:hypothetical protein
MATENDIRKFCLSLPNTEEGTSYGTLAFKVNKKSFVRWREEGDSLVLWVGDLGFKDTLLASDPKKFWTTPHYDGYASVLVRFAKVPRAEMEDLLEHAFRTRANKTTIKLLEAM